MTNQKKRLIKFKKQKILLTEKNYYINKKIYTYDFRSFKTIRTFGEDIYEGEITIEEADEDQSNLADEIKNFSNKTRPKSLEKKQEKESTLVSLYNFLKAREMVLNGLKSKIFSIKSKGSGILNTKLKIITPKQMFQRLPIALTQ